ncbi:hypothetical protein SDC9_178021 [bioreactor metagenome]|uniref:Uncharacterized protein n=1 Tax=bioreactor metagenome TaxID=1076179 RepID=A0A645GW18_9ZZZZ
MFQCIDELSDDELGGITDIIVYIPEPFADDIGALVLQQDNVVAVIGKHLFGDIEVNRRHIGNENGIVLLHRFCKYGAHVPLASPIAASRLRIRIFTAPRFAISSIFIWV